MSACPRCDTQGSAVERETLESQVKPVALSRIADSVGWSFCATSDCDVVYFRETEEVNLDSVKRTPFQKSSKPARLVCFCFEHSVGDVVRDVAMSGHSSIRDAIKEACKAGRDNCPRENPQGRCCLGNVGKVIREQEGSSGTDDCCASEPT